jgi:hypothetical protein
MAANVQPGAPAQPGIPAAAAGVPLGPPAPSTQLHQCYATLYGDTVRYSPTDPINQGPMNLMTVIQGGLDLTGSQIRRQIQANEDRVPQAWMSLSVNPSVPDDPGVIQIIHRLSFYGAPMGMPHDPEIHNRLYGLLGDLQAGRQFYNVENCSRHTPRTKKKTQHRPLSPAELKTIVPWCVEHFTAG